MMQFLQLCLDMFLIASLRNVISEAKVRGPDWFKCRHEATGPTDISNPCLPAPAGSRFGPF